MKSADPIHDRRVVIVHWKKNEQHTYEVYSNLKNFSLDYPRYSYDTLNNYLSKKKIPYENEELRIERKVIITKPTEFKKPNLPKRLFWEYDYEEINWQKAYRTVIERVVERGSKEEWNEMILFYGIKKVKQTLENETAYLSDKAIKKVCTYFNLKPENLKCYIKKQSKPRHWN